MNHRVALFSLPPRKTLLIIAGCFFALTFAIYGTSLFNEFVRFDDGLLITENVAIREISPRSLAWIFTHFDPELYIPLTFLTYQFDYLISGQNPFMFHLTNLILHTLNALLVFLFVFLLTGKKWMSLFCGLLFAVHPLHTEAVVWASARKDVLSGFFFLLSLVMYVLWEKVTRRDKRGPEGTRELLVPSHHHSSPLVTSVLSPLVTYWASVIFFLLGLLSKVSIILLPFILILIDFYEGRKITKQTLTEKVPYFLLAFLFGLIALYGKREGFEGVTILQTILMAARSTVFYIQKLFVPTSLSVLYPIERGIDPMYPEYALPLLIVIAVAALVFLLRRYREIVFGVLFFFLMISPSFQNFAKDGDYFFASDRYAYLGSIGIFFLVLSLLSSPRIERYTIQLNSIISQETLRRGLLGLVLLLFSVLAFKQSMVWKNSEALFAHAKAQYPASNARAYNNLGNVYRRQERMEEAIAMFKKAIAISPRPRTYSNLGAVYRKEGRILEALEIYRQAIEMNPEDAEPYFGMGLVYAEAGDYEKAFQAYRDAIDRDPEYAEAYSNMGAIYSAAGDYEHSIPMYQKAIEADSHFVQAYFNLGVDFTKLGREEDAIQAYRATLTIAPESIAARINLGILLYSQGAIDESKKMFKEILKRDPENVTARRALQQMP
ncbi:MAG TPA: tetratricopeptide repeat protein [Candidatus Peribacterales bacterium]|nr:tetratricopeptide repeat protein [Candidatus Peribacterales bacterium]